MLRAWRLVLARPLTRSFAAAAPSAAEAEVAATITKSLSATHVEAIDTGGGCGGSMYQIVVVSPLFEGKSTVQQHRLIKDALGDRVSGWHGFVFNSFTPAKWEARKTG